MKKLYFTLLSSLLILAGCSKDFLKNYNDRIVGTWRLVDVDRRGIGGNTGNLPFRSGQFIFEEDGSLSYVNDAGEVYGGSWNISRQYGVNDDGNKTLEITAVNFTTQDVRTEIFERIQFTGTNRFKGFIYSGAHTYVFYFRR